MKTSRIGLLIGLAVLVALGLASTSGRSSTAQAPATAPGRDYPVQPVPFTAVHLDDVFWAPRIETNRQVTIPFAFQQCERSGRVDNFERAAAALRGETLTNTKPPGYPFDDTDVYKVIEGASYALGVRPDPKLDAYVDSLIEKIGAAQEKDGYLYTARTINPQNPHRWAGQHRWELERDDSHELYNLGHLYEAAVAHYQATGKRTLLDIALRSADLLNRTFGPGKKSIWPGHQITEMGLVKLYRVTGQDRYLTLAKFLLDERGPTPGEKTNPRGLSYNQAQQRVIEQTEPVGHAVRATYMYSGMADVAALTGDAAYLKAIDTIWATTVGRKLYITGGIGASGAGEAFGRHYELPNMTAYNETCASIGMDYWNHRLFLLHGDARYIDVMERTLYNGLISGVSLDGKSFFYPNPLESNGQHERSPWFGVACCPGNITRFLASVPGYVYARTPETLYVNLFAAGRADIDMGDGRMVRVTQETRYPWDGAVKLSIAPDRARAFTINVRIPGWARNEPVPSDLYRFLPLSGGGGFNAPVGGGAKAPPLPAGAAASPGRGGPSNPPLPEGDGAFSGRGGPLGPPIGDLPTLKINGRPVDLKFPGRGGPSGPPGADDPPTLKVNGNPVDLKLDKGYVSLMRTWRAGDVIELMLPMPVRRIVAHEKVEADRDRVALQRGPIVYAAEWSDNPNGRVRNLVLPDAAALTSKFRSELLGGVQVIKGRAIGLAFDAQGRIARSAQDFMAIPYAMWANRGRGQMAVWLPRTEAVAKPTPWPTVATTSTVTTSGRKNPRPINDGEEPRSSDDPTMYFDWWPRKGTTEWVEMAFAKPATVSESEVYWFDDTGRGEVRVPKSWRILYKDGEAWTPVEALGPYGVGKDTYNRVAFKPVTTSALHLEVTLQTEWSAGLQEWKLR